MNQSKSIGRNPEAHFLDLATKVFQNPHCLTQALCHGFSQAISINRHEHKDILQLDFHHGYSGHAIIEKQRIDIRNITALAIYPGETHEMSLTPDHADAKVFSLKLKVDPAWPVIRSRFLKRCSYRDIADYRLLRALTHLVRLAMTTTSRTSLQCVVISEVLCYWAMQQEDECRSEIWASDEEISKGMNAVMTMIDGRLTNPPSLEELAAIAFMSPRNFVRRFRSMFNCAPHQYVTARRVAWARQLLAEGKMNVTEISFKMGFPSIHSFSRWFQRETKLSPSAFRQKAQLL